MKVLVNAVSIREGGPLVVFRKLIKSMRALRPEVHWAVAGPELEPACATPNLVHIRGHVPREDPLSLVRWYEFDLPAAIRHFAPDVMFSMTNYLPLRSVACPSVLLEQHAGHFSSDFDRLQLALEPSLKERLAWRLKNRWVHRSVRRADALLVQTSALANTIAKFGLRARSAIDVVPHGPGQVRIRDEVASSRTPGPVLIGYPAKFGAQKDFDALFRAASRLRGRFAFRIVLTLNPSYTPSAHVLRRAAELGVADLVENRGEIGPNGIEALYDSLDIVAFCSLSESFGFPMVEAMARGVPIVVAATAENREIVGEAGLSFAPSDDAGLARHLAMLMDDASELRRRADLSLARARDFSWEKAGAQSLAVLERVAA